MGQRSSKRKLVNTLEGEYDSCAPQAKRRRPNVYSTVNERQQITKSPMNYTTIELYTLYPPILRNLTSIEQTLFNGLDQLEAILKYRFNNKLILLEATTHWSFHNPLCSNNERLEHLGDVKLGSVVSDYSFASSTKYTPGAMTEIKSKVLCNDALGVVVVRHGLHVFLKSKLNFKKQQDIANFLQNQIRFDHSFMDEQLVFEPTGKPKEQMAVRVEIPKELGDFFEALAGAVYVDSNNSYSTLWETFSPFLQQGLGKAKENPKSVIQQVEELSPSARFKDLGFVRNRALVRLRIANTDFKGAGFNLQTAKKAASSYALKYFEPKLQHTVPVPLRGV